MKVVNLDLANVHFLCATDKAPCKNKMFYSQSEVTKNKRKSLRDRKCLKMIRFYPTQTGPSFYNKVEKINLRVTINFNAG